MSTRYYLQLHADLRPSLRRYRGEPGTPGERWEGNHWTRDCASESACLITHDRRISEIDAGRMMTQKPSAVPIV